jgi:hypothetical protein
MLDNDNRMMSSAAPACRKTYLSKIVMLTECDAEDRPVPAPAAPSHIVSFHPSVAEIRLFPSDLAASV